MAEPELNEYSIPLKTTLMTAGNFQIVIFVSTWVLSCDNGNLKTGPIRPLFEKLAVLPRPLTLPSDYTSLRPPYVRGTCLSRQDYTVSMELLVEKQAECSYKYISIHMNIMCYIFIYLNIYIYIYISIYRCLYIYIYI